MKLISHLCLFLSFVFTISPASCDTRSQGLLAQAKQTILYAPQPEYPLDARSRHITGSGLFQLRIRVSTGRVIDVEVIRSTGHSILDATAMNTLSVWRFNSGALPPLSVESPNRADPHATEDCLVKVPIKFELTKT